MSAAPPAPGHLAENVMHFARVLRHAGLPLGPDRVALSLQALQVTGLPSRATLHDVLASCLVDRVEHQALFDEAFALFWQRPGLAAAASAPPGTPRPPLAEPEAPMRRRLAEALLPRGPGAPPPPSEAPQDREPRDGLAAQAQERLRRADFDSMTAEEWQQAQRLLREMPLRAEPLPTRRRQRAASPGRADLRATLAAMGRRGGDGALLAWSRPRPQPAPLLLLADISGSMSRYSRMLLHFAHALGRAEARVESFVFGTRLTRTTRLLRHRDPDVAVAEVVRAVADWSGGTRITESLAAFHRDWARRVLPGNATVLLITDGLEAGDTRALGLQMARLHRRCRRLVWLNPLLRFAAFEPRAAGIRAMRPHCDAFLPAHNLDSLAALARVLAQPTGPRTRWRPPAAA